jgi:hypothetical protein
MVRQYGLEPALLQENTSPLQACCQVTKFIKFIARAPNDTSNFSSYPESDTQSPALKPGDDPFLDW